MPLQSPVAKFLKALDCHLAPSAVLSMYEFHLEIDFIFTRLCAILKYLFGHL